MSGMERMGTITVLLSLCIFFCSCSGYAYPDEGGNLKAKGVHASSSGGKWCVAKPDTTETKLQSALNWTCGTGPNQGNVDCSGIQEGSGGSCFEPDTIENHASYAFNQYFQQTNQQATSCSFGGIAEITTTDPSTGSCVFPQSSSLSSSSNASLSNPTPPYQSTSTGSSNGSISSYAIAHQYNIELFLFMATIMALLWM